MGIGDIGIYPRNRVIVRLPPKEGSAAQKAGIMRGDTLFEINGEHISRYEDVIRLIDGSKGAEVNVTLAEVELITGKSHQIRAHMASIGHPLAGDQKYGGHVRKGQRTQMLHAYAVRFPKLEGAFDRLSEKEFCCFVGWLKEWG